MTNSKGVDMKRFILALPAIATLLVTLVVAGCSTDCC
jgi:hypothetical protein